MTTIKRDPNKKGTGAPRGKATGVSMAATSGGAVSKDHASRSGVRRLIARDPAKGVSANIGTKRDVGIFNNSASAIPGLTGPQSPRVITARGRVGFEAKGTKHIVNRGTNRSRKNLK
jgi:hypothetical protein